MATCRGPDRRGRSVAVVLALLAVGASAATTAAGHPAGASPGAPPLVRSGVPVPPSAPLRTDARPLTAPVTGNEDAVLAEIPISGVDASPPLFDAATGSLYFGSSNPGNVTTVDPANDSIVANLTVGPDAGSVVLDSQTGDLWVSSSFSGNVSQIATNGTEVLDVVHVGGEPLDPVYDPETGDLYVVAQVASGNWTLTAINGTDGTIAGSVPLAGGSVSDVRDPVFVPVRGQLFIALNGPGPGADALEAIDPSNLTVAATFSSPEPLFAPFWDPADAELFVPSTGRNLTVINATRDAAAGSIPTGNVSAPLSWDPVGDFLLVPECCGTTGAGSVDVVSPVSGAVLASIPTPGSPGTAVLDQGNDELYIPSAAHQLEAVNASNWSHVFPVVLPSFAGSVLVGPGTDGVFAPLPFGDDVSVVGDQPLAISSFAASESSAADGSVLTVVAQFVGGVGTLQFVYTGLPRACPAPDNGSFRCVVRQSGSFDVAVLIGDQIGALAYAGQVRQLVAAPATYPVLFTESGLAAGTNWSISFNSQTDRSNGTSIGFQSPNGSGFLWVVQPPSLWLNATPAQGVLVVNGSPVLVAIHFANRTSGTNGGSVANALATDEEYGLVAAVVVAALTTSALYLRGRRARSNSTGTENDEDDDE